MEPLTVLAAMLAVLSSSLAVITMIFGPVFKKERQGKSLPGQELSETEQEKNTSQLGVFQESAEPPAENQETRETLKAQKSAVLPKKKDKSFLSLLFGPVPKKERRGVSRRSDAPPVEGAIVATPLETAQQDAAPAIENQEVRVQKIAALPVEVGPTQSLTVVPPVEEKPSEEQKPKMPQAARTFSLESLSETKEQPAAPQRGVTLQTTPEVPKVLAKYLTIKDEAVAAAKDVIPSQEGTSPAKEEKSPETAGVKAASGGAKTDDLLSLFTEEDAEDSPLRNLAKKLENVSVENLAKECQELRKRMTRSQ